jgi:glycosyltransferase involved in cell wall biosynthesis
MITPPVTHAARDAEAPASAPDAQPRRTIVHITTIPITLTFLRGQAAVLDGAGLHVHAISSPGSELAAFGADEDVPVHAVPMARQIAPFDDLVALWRLWRTLREIRPDIVDAHTPKAGLLGMLAAAAARTPVRVYHMHGLRFLTTSGWKRSLLRLTERVSCALAHRVLAVSKSVRAIAVEEGLCASARIAVLLEGTVNGVDTSRFEPLPASVRDSARAERGIALDALVVGFVGRLARDKGILELEGAWRKLRSDPRLHLLIVGPMDSSDPLPSDVVSRLHADPRVHFTGFVTDPRPLYAAMDVVVLPTYREGFPQIALEAGAMGLPLVATCVSGCVDAVADGVTGTLVPPRDAGALAEALRRYVSRPDLRSRHGEAARRRVLFHFRQDEVCDALAAEYRRLLGLRSGAHRSKRRREPAAT